ncbi:MAG: cupin domain-containing protein, partial [Wenzhouxiangellaceae bacterium]
MLKILAPLGLALLLTTSLHAQTEIDWDNAQYRITLPSENRGGKTGWFIVSALRPGGPPRHVHHDADEYMHVLDGRVRCEIDGEISEHGIGEMVYIPRGSVHTFRIISERGGSMLVTVSPSGFERFFEVVSAQGLNLSDDMGRIREIAA